MDNHREVPTRFASLVSLLPCRGVPHAQLDAPDRPLAPHVGSPTCGPRRRSRVRRRAGGGSAPLGGGLGRGAGRLNVLIAGCGYVGTELGERLARAGHRVWGIRRTPGALPPSIEPLVADLADPGLASRLPDVHHVVYAASPDRSAPEAYEQAYVRGLRNLLAALDGRVAGGGRLVLVSSTAVYPDTGGAWVDESTPTVPDSFRGRLVLEGERAALEGPLRGVVLRLGGIYGPGRTRLIDRVRAGEARCPPGEPVWSNRIHRDDAARAVEHLLTVPDPDAVYLGVDDEPASLCDVYRFVAELLGAPPPATGEPGGRVRSNKRCSNQRLRSTGFRLSYPSFREGYASMLGMEGAGGVG